MPTGNLGVLYHGPDIQLTAASESHTVEILEQLRLATIYEPGIHERHHGPLILIEHAINQSRIVRRSQPIEGRAGFQIVLVWVNKGHGSPMRQIAKAKSATKREDTNLDRFALLGGKFCLVS